MKILYINLHPLAIEMFIVLQNKQNFISGRQIAEYN